MYGIFVSLDAIYDVGMYGRFFLLGPGYLRKLSELDSKENFSALQIRLFMKHCAAMEIKKATGEQPRKLFTELCMIRSLRNQVADRVTSWKNLGTFLSNAGKSGPL